MKKYKNGLVLGKMYPVTLGHIYLINTAIENCKTVHVIITHNSTQSIPGQVRYDALNKIYKNNSNVIIYLISDEGLPQSDSECESLDEFYSYWIPLVYSNVDELDVVFTSEDYGDSFAKYLNVEHYLVDKERINYPISGTKVRSNPFENWNFIPDEMKRFFIKRVAIMGPESVGKSTLTQNLANILNTNFVIEYGRLIYEINNSIELKDFIPISKGRQEIEDWIINSSNKYLICDTEDITTYIFSKLFFPNEYKSIESYFIDSIKSKPKYDLYILLKPDVNGVQDGTRKFLDSRVDHYQIIKSELISNNCNFIEIGGNWKERQEKSIEEILKLNIGK